MLAVRMYKTSNPLIIRINYWLGCGRIQHYGILNNIQQVMQQSLQKEYDVIDLNKIKEALGSGRKVHYLPQYRHDNIIQIEKLTGIHNSLVNEFSSKELIKAVINQRSFKSEEEIKGIAAIIPQEWKNNKEQKTDVAYLFPEVDSIETLDEIPVKREYIDFIYVKGAIIWHIMKEDYNRSQLNKLVGIKLYQLMTIRNVNTARFLAGHKKNVK